MLRSRSHNYNMEKLDLKLFELFHLNLRFEITIFRNTISFILSLKLDPCRDRFFRYKACLYDSVRSINQTKYEMCAHRATTLESKGISREAELLEAGHWYKLCRFQTRQTVLLDVEPFETSQFLEDCRLDRCDKII